ncbi:hypothetical protein [Sphingomonas sp. RB1R13]|uniref:hypothetical protein n=1 Tax=Sphingomonas sp. RB1R13 TaxID=3096159 RepID=UPI002FCAD8A0
MNTQVATTDHDMWQALATHANDDVIRCVASQERLERSLPMATMLAVWGVFALLTLVNPHRDVLGMIIGAVFTFFIAKLVGRGLRALILEPSRRIRYNRAATRLRAQVQAGGDVAVGPFSWTIGAPGSMAITRSGEVVMLDHAHQYEPLRLAPHQIADVRVERQSQQITQTHHGGRTSIAGLGGSFGMAYTMGGRSTSVTSTVDEYVLEIRYQMEKNGPVSTVTVPGGSDRRVVEELCASIRRLEA